MRVSVKKTMEYILRFWRLKLFKVVEDKTYEYWVFRRKKR